MLVLLGPPFEGTEEQYAALARITKMVAYDLKTKLRPGTWGVVRALGNAAQAEDLTSELRAHGFRVCLVGADVAHDPNRPIVNLRAIELGTDEMILHLRERVMPVPYEALLTIVRGEVQIGRQYGRPPGSTSSAGVRAVAPSAADMALFRDAMATTPIDAFAAADLHFVTVLWCARIDARHFDFSSLGQVSESAAQDLDRFVDLLAERAGARVDRNIKSSSVASFAARPAPMRSATPAPAPQTARGRDAGSDDRFDAYSRFIAEAERQARAI
jgi:hypothetical protein